MSYEPVEGVDYLINLYAVAGEPTSASKKDLKQSINKRIREYHPDRLEGLAPEFRRKGERMAALLNRARVILLDDTKRREYDEILSTWDGPFSTDGTPAMNIGRLRQIEMADKTPEEVEAWITANTERTARMTGYSPSRLDFLEGFLENFDGEINEALRAEYEDALLQRDRTLAIEESERSELLGLPDIGKQNYAAALGYSQQIKDRIEIAKTARLEGLHAQALGGVSMRLAILSGQDTTSESGTIFPADSVVELPAYFEEQAKKVADIASEREAITVKRLANIEPTYPEAEHQVDFKGNLAIGLSGLIWVGVTIEEGKAQIARISPDLQKLLEEGDFRAVIENGYNVLTVEFMDHINPEDLVVTAIEKYIQKYESNDSN